MSIKIFHTGDLHLGLKFANYPSVQQELCEARFKTLMNIVVKANEYDCDMLTIAGDLFDRVGIAKRDVLHTAGILNDFSGKLVVILPGNHDFFADEETGLWRHFIDVGGDKTLLLKEKRPYSLKAFDIDAVIYPAPCDRKHSSTNYIGWIKDSPKDPRMKNHIGIAHGSLEGVSPDFNARYYPMKRQQLADCNLDLWLLGHTHIQYPSEPGVKDSIFYPATPEPDGFDCRHEGRAWILEIDDKKNIVAQSIATGIYRFREDKIVVKNAADIKDIRQKYLAESVDTLVLKLNASGCLPKDDYDLLASLRQELENNVFLLRWTNDVTEAITPSIIDKEFTEGSLPHKLLSTFAKEQDHEALQIAYELIQEVRK